MICYLAVYSVTYFAKKVNILLKNHHRLLRRLTSLQTLEVHDKLL